MDYGLDGIVGLGYMEYFTYSMTLASDLTGSQWIRWKSGFLCGLESLLLSLSLWMVSMGMVI